MSTCNISGMVHQTYQRLLRLVMGCALALGFLLLIPSIGEAATYKVNTPDDNATFNLCGNPSPGKCSLRGALQWANGSIGTDDTIHLPAGHYKLNGYLPIEDGVTIIGSNGDANGNPGVTIIDAQSNAEVFIINSGLNKAFNTTIKAVTIQNGTGWFGGGISWDAGGTGTLTIENSVIRNSVSEFGGGGLSASNAHGASGQGEVIIRGTLIEDNAAPFCGGGIWWHFTLRVTIEDSIIIGNQSTAVDSAGGGGGICADGDSDSPLSTIKNTAIINNVAASPGGGIWSAQPLNIINTTISGNTSATNGGGLALDMYVNKTTTLTNVTITENTTSGAGGGLYHNRLGNPSQLILYNTIVAGNKKGAAANDIVSNATLDAASSHNLIGTGGAGGIAAINGNQVNVADPGLGALTDTLGGNTWVHPLLLGSPALDAGDNTKASEDTDQRGTGFARKLDFVDAINTPQVDIGAFEFQVSIGEIEDQTASLGKTLTGVTFQVSNAPGLILTATSDDHVVVPEENITFGGTGLVRTLAITPAHRGTTTITVTAATQWESMETSFQLTVKAAAERPSVSNHIGVEDEPVTDIRIERNASNGDEVTHFKISNIVGGTLYRNDGTTAIADGAFITAAQGAAGLVFKPQADANSLAGDTFGFDVQASLDDQGDGLSPASTVNIGITEVNDRPTAVNDTLASAAEDAPTFAIPFDALLANDKKGPANESGQELTIVDVSNATGGSVRIVGETVEFTLDRDFNGTASFTYTVEDNGTTNGDPDPKQDTATVDFTVTEVNDPPIAGDDEPDDIFENSGNYQIPIEFLLENDTPGPDDEKSDQKLTIISVTAVRGGLVSIDGDYITFMPIQDFTGVAEFRYTVRDDGTTNGVLDARTAEATVRFNVKPSARRPHVTSATTEEDKQSTAGLVITEDAVDVGSVTHFKITDITGGTLYLNDGVTPVNDGDFISLAEGAEGLKFTPAQDLNSDDAGDTFGFTVKGAFDADGTGLGHVTTVTIRVTEVNDPPIANDDLLIATFDEDAAFWPFSFDELTNNDEPGPANERGQELTIIKVENPVGGTVVIVATDIIFTPDPDFSGIASFTYTVEDNGTTNGDPAPLTDTATVTFTINPIADLPTISATTTVESTRSGPITITRSAVDGTEIAFFKITGITGGTLYAADGVTVINNGDFIEINGGIATVTFMPNKHENSPANDVFGFTAQGAVDQAGTGLGPAVTLSITVTEFNDAPTAVDDTLPDVAEDSPSWVIPSATLLLNDLKGPANESGQTLTIVSVGNAVGGTATVNGDGDILFELEEDFYGEASFEYTIEDNGTTNGVDDFKRDTATVRFTVTEVNDKPSAEDDELESILEDSPPLVIPFADLLENDKAGPENEHTQALTIIGLDNVTSGTVYLEGNSVIYLPSPHYHGPVSFTYIMSDNGTTGGKPAPLTDTATVTFMIDPVADEPVVTGTITEEDTQSTTGLRITRNPEDGIEVTHFRITDITGGVLYHHDGLTVINNGDFITVEEGAPGLKFTPAKDLNSPAGDIFGFTVHAALDDQGTGISTGRTVTITVTEVNDPPIATDDTLSDIDEDSGPRTITFAELLDNDKAGPENESDQNLTIRAIGSSEGDTVDIDIVGRRVIFTPAENFHGIASFTYTLQDDGTTAGEDDFQQAIATVSFRVNPVADQPTGVGTTTVEDTLTDPIIISRNAVDGDEIAYFKITDITGGALYDGIGAEVHNNGFVPLVAGTATFTFMPHPNLNTLAGDLFHFTVQGAEDATGKGLGVGLTITITVTEVNDAPEPENDTLLPVAEDSPARTIPIATLLVNDSPGPNEAQPLTGQTLTFIGVDNAFGGTVELDGMGNVIFTLEKDFNGTASFTYTVEDNGTTDGVDDFKRATATVSFTVTEVNDPPIAVDDQFDNILEDTALVIPFANLLANDKKGPDNENHQELTIISVGNADNGTVGFDGNTVVFIPTADYHGAASFTYTVEDNGTTNGVDDFKRATATVTFEIDPVADPPVAANATTVEDTPTDPIIITPNIVDDEVTYFRISGIVGGTLHTKDGTPINNNDYITVAEGADGLTFVPADDLNNLAGDIFGFTVQGAVDSTGTGLGVGTTVTITVTAVNDPPIARDDNLPNVKEDSGPHTIAFATLLANDDRGPANESGQILTITNVRDAEGGAVVIENGEIIFTLTPDFFGTASFIYDMEDDATAGAPASLTASATVRFEVEAVPDEPVAVYGTGREDTPVENIVITRSLVDKEEITHFMISLITGGRLYQSDGDAEIQVGAFITVDDGAAGLIFVPEEDRNSPDGTEFQFVVHAALGTRPSDAGPGTTVELTIAEVNDPPILEDDELSAVLEDSGAREITFAELLLNDKAGPANEGEKFTITGVHSPHGGSVAIEDDNDKIIFTLTPNFYGTASFIYEVTDEGTTNGGPDPQTSAATVTFTVEPLADAPVVTGASTTAEDTPSEAIFIHRNLVDGLEITHFKITGITGGTLSTSDDAPISNGDFITAAQGADGLTFTPAKDLNTQAGDTFGFTVQAALGANDATLSPVTPVSITVNAVNDQPVAEDDTLPDAVEDDDPIEISFATLLANDTKGADNESDQELTITSVHSPHGGDVEIRNGKIYFSLAPNFHGTASFQYDVTDDGTPPETATATVSFTVEPRADAPEAAPATTLEDVQSEAIAISRNLADGIEVTHFLITAITGGTLYQSDGTAPIANGDFITVVQGADGLRFTPDADQHGTNFGFTVQAVQGIADPNPSVPTQVTITVGPVADPPIIADATTAEDTPLPGLVISRNPVDGAEVTHFKITGITGGTLYTSNDTPISNGDLITDTNLKFIPAKHLNSPALDTFSFTVQGAVDSIGTGLGVGTTVTITVTEVNDPPEPEDDELDAVLEDADPIEIAFNDLLKNDVAGPDNESDQELTITAVRSAHGGTVGIDGGKIIFTLAVNFHGTASFIYDVTDNGTTAGDDDHRTASATVTFMVEPVADAPVASGATETAEDTQSDEIIIGRNPADAGEVTHFKITGITGGTLYLSDGTTEVANGDFITAAQGAAGLKFTPADDLNTPAGDTFGFTVQGATDDQGAGLGAGTLVTLIVTEVNDRPVANDDELDAVLEDADPIEISFDTLLDNDTKGAANEGAQTLTITSVQNATGGTVEIVDDTIVFTLEPNFHGTASFDYTIEDDGTTDGDPDPLTATGTVTFTVESVNDAPVATGGNLTVMSGRTVTGTLTATDIEGDPLTYELVDLPLRGTLNLIDPDTGTYTYRGGSPGNFTFTFRAFDGTDYSNVATISIRVNAVPEDAPPQPPTPPTPLPPEPDPPTVPKPSEPGPVGPPAETECPADLCRDITARPEAPLEIRSDFIEIVIAPGAIQSQPDQSVEIRVTRLRQETIAEVIETITLPDDFQAIGKGFDVEVIGGTIVGPITLRIPLTPAEMALINDPEKVGLFRVNEDGTVTFVGGKLVDGVLIVELHSFSRYMLAEVAISFWDLVDHWSRTDVERMAAKFIVRGFPDGSFQPNASVTRAEFASMLVRAMGLRPAAATQTFTDVNPDDWFYAEVSTAVAAGVARGMGDGTFAPNELVTREQAAAMVMRALRAQHKAGALTPDQIQSLLAPFGDQNAISDWAIADAAGAVAADILRGRPDGTLNPIGTATRAEAATIMARFWRK